MIKTPNLWLGAPQLGHHTAIFGGFGHCNSGEKIWVEIPHSNHHRATFNDQRPCGSRDRRYLICHVTSFHVNTYLQGCVTLGTEAPYSNSPSCQV